MGWTILYIAFAIVALWLLGEVLLQYKARLRWRLLAFFGFLCVVIGVVMYPSVPLIGVGTAAFAVGQTFVTLSFRRGFAAGWALKGVPPLPWHRPEEERSQGAEPVDASPALQVSELTEAPVPPPAAPPPGAGQPEPSEDAAAPASAAADPAAPPPGGYGDGSAFDVAATAAYPTVGGDTGDGERYAAWPGDGYDDGRQGGYSAAAYGGAQDGQPYQDAYAEEPNVFTPVSQNTYDAGYSTGYDPSSPGGYGADGYGADGYGGHRGYDDSGYRPDSGYRVGDDPQQHAYADTPAPGGHPADGYGTGGYGADAYGADGYGTGGYGADGYRADGYGGWGQDGYPATGAGPTGSGGHPSDAYPADPYAAPQGDLGSHAPAGAYPPENEDTPPGGVWVPHQRGQAQPGYPVDPQGYPYQDAGYGYGEGGAAPGYGAPAPQEGDGHPYGGRY